MNIPKKDVVAYVLAEALRKRKVSSQRSLAELINKKFKKSRSGYSVSSPRARRIALRTSGISVRIHTRKGPLPKRCPACGYSLKKTFTRNLKGRRILHILSCTRCPYKGSGGRWLPKRYEFWSF